MAVLIDFNDEFIKKFLPKLLKDKTSKKNILFEDKELIINFPASTDLKPRILKSQDEQNQRTKKIAEVFTPAGICCEMIDNLDYEFFDGRLNFSDKKFLKKYIDLRYIEITCGEAPFIILRYDAASGEEIEIEKRTGILDRKLRVINENFSDRQIWLKWVLRAFQSVYGFELQGDSLLIARINLLMTFIEYYKYKWNDFPRDYLFKKYLTKIVNVIVWNFWQMDGLIEPEEISQQINLFDFESPSPKKNSELKIFNWRSNFSFNYYDIERGLAKFMKKFDFCIGNPPYQEEIKNTSDSPVYNFFMDAAYKIADVIELIHPARFLFNAGKTPKEWNEKMLNDKHFKVLKYEQDSSKIFRNTDIKGGVAITIRNSKKNYGKIGAFSVFNELNSILKKVLNFKGFKTLDDLIITQNKWKLDTLYADYPELKLKIGSDGKEKRFTTSILGLTEIFHDEAFKGDVLIVGLINNKRVKKYVDRKYLLEHENLDKWKVILPKSNGSGAIGEVLSTPLVGEPLVGEPLVGYTQSFIGIGKFDTQNEAEALFKYIKTKFARCMLGILKVTQDNNKGTWRYVPLQNFKSDSDIDWEKSVKEIDAQLYKKYGLSDKEIKFIEEHVKEMN